MRIFKITADKYRYDEFDSAIVACESKEKLQKLIDDGAFYSRGGISICGYYEKDPKCLSIFKEYQKLSIEEIELDKIKDTEIILGSFNAG